MLLYSHCSVFLGNIREAFAKNSDLTNLLMDDFFTKAIHDCQVGSQAIYTLQDTRMYNTSTHIADYLHIDCRCTDSAAPISLSISYNLLLIYCTVLMLYMYASYIIY